MTDEELVRGFEAAELATFHHADHVRAAWWYVTHEPLLVAIARFRAALQRFAAAKGKPDRYHETITIALLLLIADRRRDGEAWKAFAGRNADLLQWPCPALQQLYSNHVLDSAVARDRFVVPDGVLNHEIVTVT